MKSIFAEHGIPSQLITYNGPQYNCREFRQFRETYGIEHTTSSPLYPQSNGFAERMVQTVKGTLRKYDEEGGASYLGILSYRTTPVDHQLKSPAELLNNRKFPTTLPTAQRALLTDIDRGQIKESLYGRQKQQVQYYNCLPDNHYHGYMTVNTSACMTHVPGHGSQEQSRDGLVHLDPMKLNRAQLEPCTVAQNPN